MKRISCISSLLIAFLLSISAIAQDDEGLIEEIIEPEAEPAPAAPAPAPEPASQPAQYNYQYQTQPQAAQPTAAYPAQGTNAAYPAQGPAPAGDEVSGFELGINFAGSNEFYAAGTEDDGWTWEQGAVSKVGIQPGWNLGRIGIYLLLGMNLSRTTETSLTNDWALGSFTNPGEGGAETEDYHEKAEVMTSVFTFDAGLALRIYLLEKLRTVSPALYLEIDLGWRGASAKAELDWVYTGDPDLLPDDVGSTTFEYEETFNKAAEDYANAVAEQYDGFWANLGIGGEYVFAGGFGVAGEAGFHFFFNNEWIDKSPFGYDDDGDIGDVDWDYISVKWSGTGMQLGLYYSLALRYHF